MLKLILFRAVASAKARKGQRPAATNGYSIKTTRPVSGDMMRNLQYRLKSLVAKASAGKLATTLVLILGLCLAIVADGAQAQQAPASFVRNRGNPTLYLNNVSSFPAAAAIGADVTEAEWVLAPVPDQAASVHIQNVGSKLNLHTQNGFPELGILAPGSTADVWQVEPVAGQLFVRIKSVTTGLYLGLQDVTGPLSLVPLNLGDPAASPSLPPTADWEFISAATVTPGVAVAVPLAAADPVAFATVAPFISPRLISRAGSCGGGKIFFNGDCVCPRDTVDINGRCRFASFACDGGDVVGGECLCPDARLAVQIGPRRLSCDRLPNVGFRREPAQLAVLGGADVSECNGLFRACDRAGEPLRSCRASQQSCLADKRNAASDAANFLNTSTAIAIALQNAAADAATAKLKADADAAATQRAVANALAAQAAAIDAAQKTAADAAAAAAQKAAADALAAQTAANDAAAKLKADADAAAAQKTAADAAAKLKAAADAAQLAADAAAAKLNPAADPAKPNPVADPAKLKADADAAAKLKADADAAKLAAGAAAAKLKADADAALKPDVIAAAPKVKITINGVAIVID